MKKYIALILVICFVVILFVLVNVIPGISSAQAKQKEVKLLPIEETIINDLKQRNEIGRFQLAADPGGCVWVLDTKKGIMSYYFVNKQVKIKGTDTFILDKTMKC